MRRTLTASALIAATLMLTACGSETPKARQRDDVLQVIQQKLPDGRTVTCVSFDTISATGDLNCDWEHAK